MSEEQIIQRLIANSAEIITQEELRVRLGSREKLTHYIGFEISGYVHIGQGIMSALVMKDLMDLGVKCTVWLADWHTAINQKLDGTKETAARIGQRYFTEAIKACLLAVGADPAQVDFRLASQWYAKDALGYFELVRQVQHHTTLARMLRSIDIMGKEAGQNVETDKLLYPAMQVADIFYQDLDIAHSGMDQRKAHVIMRDVADKIRPDQGKPIALHHPLLDSLQGGGEEHKMSKSRPESAVFIHDQPADIERKISKAFCSEKEVNNNPVLNWTKHVLAWNRSSPFRIERESKHGGPVEFAGYEELEAAFAAGDVHPMDLKAMVAKELITLLAPVREHFAKSEVAAKKEELDKVLQSK